MCCPVYLLLLAPVLGQGSESYGMSVVDMPCITLGESATSWAEKFLKNLPLAPLAPPPKLDGTRPSFAVGGTFEKSILPPFCPLRPRWGCFIDDLDTSEQSADSELLCDYSEGRRSCQGVVRVLILS